MTRAAVLIHKNDEYLLVQERAAPVHGKWNWVQGLCEGGELSEDAAVREAKEEIGFDVDLGGLITIIRNPFPDTKELRVYAATVRGGELSFPKNEIMDARWHTLEGIEAIQDQLVGEWVLETIRLQASLGSA